MVRALNITSLNDDCTLAASSEISEGKHDRVGRNARRATGALTCAWSSGEAETTGWEVSLFTIPVSLSSAIRVGVSPIVSPSSESVSERESM